MLLKVAGVTKRFGGLVANQNISVTVNAGEIVGLIGPNGAGKTTFFDVVSGYYRPDSGTVLLGSEEITGKSPNQVNRKGISRTFQAVRLFGDMTLLENVMVAYLSRNGNVEEAREKALKDLNAAGIEGYKDVPANSAPFGCRRQVELARALATKPKLLLVDEIAAGLDASVLQGILGRLVALRNDGLGILIIEHNMKALMSVSDRVTVLNLGEQIAEGTPAEVSANPEVIRAYFGEKRA